MPYIRVFLEGQEKSDEDSRRKLMYVLVVGAPVIAGTTVGGVVWRKRTKK